jgi:hypothetical protein
MTDKAQREDVKARDEAGRMSVALDQYAKARHAASVAEGSCYPIVGHGAADKHRADARAALHFYPELLAMLER